MPNVIRILTILIAAAPFALAHPGHDQSSFAVGFIHPLGGLDHLLAMVAVGVLAVRCATANRRALWLLPATFMSAMVLGGVSALFVQLPAGAMNGVEWGIALSVLVFGGLIALNTQPRLSLAGGIVGAFALLHGHAHVAELAAGQSFGGYTAGFFVATGLLHAVGILTGVVLARALNVGAVRLAGVGIAMASVALAVGLLR